MAETHRPPGLEAFGTIPEQEGALIRSPITWAQSIIRSTALWLHGLFSAFALLHKNTQVQDLNVCACQGLALLSSCLLSGGIFPSRILFLEPVMNSWLQIQETHTHTHTHSVFNRLSFMTKHALVSEVVLFQLCHKLSIQNNYLIPRFWITSSCSAVSDSLWPARLLCPWDSPGRNTGVGCHFLL